MERPRNTNAPATLRFFHMANTGLWTRLFVILILLACLCGVGNAMDPPSCQPTALPTPTAFSSLPLSYYPSLTYPSGFTLSKNNLLGIFSLPLQYAVTFDLFPTAYPGATSPASILRLTAGAADYMFAADRLPAIFMCDSNTWTSCVNGGIHSAYQNGMQPYGTYFMTGQALPLNAWSAVTLTVDNVNLLFTSGVSGAVTIATQSSSFPTPPQTTWPYVQVYASDMFYSAATAAIRNIAIFETTNAPTALPVSYYPSSSYPSGFALISNNMIGVVALPPSYTVIFDLYPTSIGYTGWRSVLCLTATGGNFPTGAGSRLPSVMLFDNNGLEIVHYASADEGPYGKSWSPNQVQIPPLNAWSTVTIAINSVDRIMSVAITGGLTWTQTMSFPTPPQTTWPAVRVYATDSWYLPASAIIRNIAIFVTTSAPTPSPTYSFPIPSLVGLGCYNDGASDAQFSIWGYNGGPGGGNYQAVLSKQYSFTSAEFMTATDCFARAYADGYAYVGLENVGSSTSPATGVCFGGSDISLASTYGTAPIVASSNYVAQTRNCGIANDGFLWGGGWAVAIYAFPQPSAKPTPQPTLIPTPDPTVNPTVHPSPIPTAQPTVQPTRVPTTAKPTAVPSPQPSSKPSAPTFSPTAAPTQVEVTTLSTSGSPAITSPQFLSLDSSSTYLYMTDNMQLVRRIHLSTGVVTNLGTSASPVFFGVKGVSIDSSSKYLYVGDFSNNLVRRIDLSTDVVTTIGTSANPAFNQPCGISINKEGTYLYVADMRNNLVRRVHLTSGAVTNHGTSSYNGPWDVSVDSTSTYLYVADRYNDLIRRIDLSSDAVTNIGTTASPAFNNPVGVAVDSSSTYVYVSDIGNNLLRRIELSSGAVTSLGATVNYYFRFLEGLSVDQNGTYLYVVDSGSGHDDGSVKRVALPVGQPSYGPTGQPTSLPSGQPSKQPTGQPTVLPTMQPTSQPSRQPSSQPSRQPTRQPTGQPSRQPSSKPSRQPSRQPTRQPSGQPTRLPSGQPTGQPTGQPSRQPSAQPSGQPTCAPICPSSQPTRQPSGQPTRIPTGQPSRRPSAQPTRQPTGQPSRQPTRLPTGQPTQRPSSQPSRQPTSQPSHQPNSPPTGLPSRQPSGQPSLQPFSLPTGQPSMQPTTSPTSLLQQTVSMEVQYKIAGLIITAAQFTSSAVNLQHFASTLALTINLQASATTGKSVVIRSSEIVVGTAQDTTMMATTGRRRLTSALQVDLLLTFLPAHVGLIDPLQAFDVVKSAVIAADTAGPNSFASNLQSASAAPDLTLATATLATIIGQATINVLHSAPPTFAPTATPTKGMCVPGEYSVQDICTPCPAGSFCPNSGLATESTLCPAGTYSDAGSSSCTNCGIKTPNQYSSAVGLSSVDGCQSCPSGLVSLPGSTSAGSCNSLTNSYSMGAISLFLAFIAVYAYIINGGFIHIATDRQMVKDKLVARSRNLAKTLRVRLEANRVKNIPFSTVHRSPLRLFIFLLGASVIVLVCMCLGTLWTSQGVFYSVFILWRSQVSLSGVKALADDFQRALLQWVDLLARVYSVFQLDRVVRALTVPIIVVVRWLASLNLLNLVSGLSVTCSGGTASLYIILDLWIFFVIVFIVQGQFLYVGRARQKVCRFYLNNFTKKEFMTRTKTGFLTVMGHVAVVAIMSAVNTTTISKSVLRFLLTLPVFAEFFIDGHHAWTDQCNVASPVGFDAFMAISATILMYFLIYPSIFTLGIVCTPQGEPGVFKSRVLKRICGNCIDAHFSLEETPADSTAPSVSKRVENIVDKINSKDVGEFEGRNDTFLGIDSNCVEILEVSEGKEDHPKVCKYLLSFSPVRIGVADPDKALELLNIIFPPNPPEKVDAEAAVMNSLSHKGRGKWEQEARYYHKLKRIYRPVAEREPFIPKLKALYLRACVLFFSQSNGSPAPPSLLSKLRGLVSTAAAQASSKTSKTKSALADRSPLAKRFFESAAVVVASVAAVIGSAAAVLSAIHPKDFLSRILSLLSLDLWVAQIDNQFLDTVNEICQKDVVFHLESETLFGRISVVPIDSIKFCWECAKELWGSIQAAAKQQYDMKRPIAHALLLALSPLILLVGLILWPVLYLLRRCASVVLSPFRGAAAMLLRASTRGAKGKSGSPQLAARTKTKTADSNVFEVWGHLERIKEEQKLSSKADNVDPFALDDLPTYSFMCNDICESMDLFVLDDVERFLNALEDAVQSPTLTSRLVVFCCLVPFALTVLLVRNAVRLVMILLVYLGPAQFLTRKGRQYFLIVIDKYLTLVEVVLGFWDDKIGECYGVQEAIEEYDAHRDLNRILDVFITKQKEESEAKDRDKAKAKDVLKELVAEGFLVKLETEPDFISTFIEEHSDGRSKEDIVKFKRFVNSFNELLAKCRGNKHVISGVKELDDKTDADLKKSKEFSARESMMVNKKKEKDDKRITDDDRSYILDAFFTVRRAEPRSFKTLDSGTKKPLVDPKTNKPVIDPKTNKPKIDHGFWERVKDELESMAGNLKKEDPSCKRLSALSSRQPFDLAVEWRPFAETLAEEATREFVIQALAPDWPFRSSKYLKDGAVKEFEAQLLEKNSPPDKDGEDIWELVGKLFESSVGEQRPDGTIAGLDVVVQSILTFVREFHETFGSAETKELLAALHPSSVPSSSVAGVVDLEKGLPANETEGEKPVKEAEAELAEAEKAKAATDKVADEDDREEGVEELEEMESPHEFFQDVEGLLVFSKRYAALYQDLEEDAKSKSASGSVEEQEGPLEENMKLLREVVTDCILHQYATEKRLDQFSSQLVLTEDNSKADKADSALLKLGRDLYALLHAINIPRIKSEEIEKRNADRVTDCSDLTSAIVSTRACLFQVVPALTLVSIYSSYMSSSPFTFINIVDEDGELKSAMPWTYAGVKAEEKISEKIGDRAKEAEDTLQDLDGRMERARRLGAGEEDEEGGDGDDKGEGEGDGVEGAAAAAAAGAEVLGQSVRKTNIASLMRNESLRFHQERKSGDSYALTYLFGIFTTDHQRRQYEVPEFLTSIQDFATQILLSRVFNVLHNAFLYISTVLLYSTLGLSGPQVETTISVSLGVIIVASVIFWGLVGAYGIVSLGKALQVETEDYTVMLQAWFSFTNSLRAGLKATRQQSTGSGGSAEGGGGDEVDLYSALFAPAVLMRRGGKDKQSSGDAGSKHAAGDDQHSYHSSSHKQHHPAVSTIEVSAKLNSSNSKRITIYQTSKRAAAPAPSPAAVVPVASENQAAAELEEQKPLTKLRRSSQAILSSLGMAIGLSVASKQRAAAVVVPSAESDGPGDEESTTASASASSSASGSGSATESGVFAGGQPEEQREETVPLSPTPPTPAPPAQLAPPPLLAAPSPVLVVPRSAKAFVLQPRSGPTRPSPLRAAVLDYEFQNDLDHDDHKQEQHELFSLFEQAASGADLVADSVADDGSLASFSVGSRRISSRPSTSPSPSYSPSLSDRSASRLATRSQRRRTGPREESPSPTHTDNFLDR